MRQQGKRFSTLCTAIAVAGVACATQIMAQDLEHQLTLVVNKIVAGMEEAKLKRLTVVDFTNPQDEVTELGRYIAGELETSLFEAKGKFGVVDRRNVRRILAEHKLAVSGLIDPETAKKLGQWAEVDAIVTGTLTPLGKMLKLNVKVVATETATVVGAARGEVAKTAAIEELLGHSAPEGASDSSGERPSTLSASAGTKTRPGVFENQYLRLTVRSVTVGGLRSFGGPQLTAVCSMENLTGFDISASWYEVQLLSEENGQGWRSNQSVGMVVGPGENTHIAPRGRANFSVRFHREGFNNSGDTGAIFDLIGKLEVIAADRKMQVPITINGLRLQRGAPEGGRGGLLERFGR